MHVADELAADRRPRDGRRPAGCPAVRIRGARVTAGGSRARRRRCRPTATCSADAENPVARAIRGRMPPHDGGDGDARRPRLARDGGDLDELLARARDVRERAWGAVVTYSPKVFIPLTALCRDVCHYCTFARPPRRGERAYLTIEEVLAIARAGAAAGCREALFTLGDKPELRYRAAREELAELGLRDDRRRTWSRRAARRARGDRPAAAREPRHPRRRASCSRCATVCAVAGDHARDGLGPAVASAAGRTSARPTRTRPCGSTRSSAPARLRIPFTSGILIGIGETRTERVEALLALRDAARAARPPAGGDRPELPRQGRHEDGRRARAVARRPPLDDRRRAAAPARRTCRVQAPPNLALRRLPAAARGRHQRLGRRLARDARPRQPRGALAGRSTGSRGHRRGRPDARCRACRLPALPARPRALARPARRAARAPRADGARPRAAATAGSPGATPRPPPSLARPRSGGVSRAFADALARASAAQLGEARGDRAALGARRPSVDAARAPPTGCARERCGDEVTLRRLPEHQLHQRLLLPLRLLRVLEGQAGREPARPAYLLAARRDRAPLRTRRGSAARTEVCLQGGIHPGFTGDWYLELVEAIKDALPDLHIHAFSPLEVWQGAATLGMPLRDYLARLRDAGLGSLPGTAAEILDDEVRRVALPRQGVDTAQWLEVHAHGARARPALDVHDHVRPRRAARARARHLLALRDQARGPAASPSSCRCRSCTPRRRSGSRAARAAGRRSREAVAAARRRAAAAAPAHHEHPGVVGQARPAGARRLLGAGVERPRRHAHERVDLARGRRRATARRCPPERMDAVIRAAGPRAAAAHDAVRPPAPERQARVVRRAAAAPTRSTRTSRRRASGGPSGWCGRSAPRAMLDGWISTSTRARALRPLRHPGLGGAVAETPRRRVSRPPRSAAPSSSRPRC